jgi:hypothetical protein
MFCPLCKYEYRPGFTHCADCDVDLVETLDMGPTGDSAQSPRSQDDATGTPRMLWSGIDNSAFTQIRTALDEAGIPYNDEPLEARLLYSSMRDPLEIWVHQSDYDDARKLVSKVFGRDPNDDPAFTIPGDPIGGADGYGLKGVQEPGLAEDLDDREIVDGWDRQDGIDTFENFDPEEATLEIWHGDDAMLGQVLKDCLRENRIGSNLDCSQPKSCRIFVYPSASDRACEIVRQVIEGVPPE